MRRVVLGLIAALLVCRPAFALTTTLTLTADNKWNLQFYIGLVCDTPVQAPATSYAIQYNFPLRDAAGVTYTIAGAINYTAQNPLCPLPANGVYAFQTASGTLPAAIDPATAALTAQPLNFPPGTHALAPPCVAPYDNCTGSYAPIQPAYVQFWNTASGALFDSVPDSSNRNPNAVIFTQATPQLPPVSFAPLIYTVPPSVGGHGLDCKDAPATAPCDAGYFLATWQCADGSGRLPAMRTDPKGYTHLILCPDATNPLKARPTLPLTPVSPVGWFLDDSVNSSPGSSPIAADFSFYDSTTVAAGGVDSFSDFEGEVSGCARQSPVQTTTLSMFQSVDSNGTVCIIGLANNSMVDYDAHAAYIWSTFPVCCTQPYPNLQWFPGKYGANQPSGNGCPDAPLPPANSGQVVLPQNASTTGSEGVSWFFGGNDQGTTPPFIAGPCSQSAFAPGAASYYSQFISMTQTNIIIQLQGTAVSVDPTKLVINAGNGIGPEFPLVYAIYNYYGPDTNFQVNFPNCKPVPGICGSAQRCHGAANCPYPGHEGQVYIQYLGQVAFQTFQPGCAGGKCFDPDGAAYGKTCYSRVYNGDLSAGTLNYTLNTGATNKAWTNSPGNGGITLPGGFVFNAKDVLWAMCGNQAHTNIQPLSAYQALGWTVPSTIKQMLLFNGTPLYPLPPGSLPPP